MNFELTEDQLVLQKTVRDFCAREVIPRARALGRGGALPAEVIPAMGEMGLLGMQIPEAYGGAGMKFHDYVVALEEVARADGSLGLTMASHNSLCTGHIFLAGNEAQKQQVPAAAGHGQGAGRLGPDRAGLGLRRRRRQHPAPQRRGQTTGCINGTKTFITQGSVAEHLRRSSPRPAPRRSRRG